MVMKRSATSSLSPTPDLDASSDFAPSPPSSTLVSTPKKTAGSHKKVKVEPRSDEPEHKDVKPKVTTPSKKGGAAGGPWTPAKKRELAEIVIARGLASISAEELATLLGVTKQQIRDATQKGKNNLRGRLIAAAERI